MAELPISLFFDGQEANLIRQRDELMAALKLIEQEFAFLAKMRRDAESVAHQKQSANGSKKSTELLGPSDAVLAYVKKHPGVSRTELRDRLEGQMKTESTKPRELLRTVIGQLVKKGRLEESEKGLNLPEGK